MKVLLVSLGVYPEGRAGTEIHTYELGRALAVENEVHILAPSAGPGRQYDVEGARVTLVQYEPGIRRSARDLRQRFVHMLDSLRPEVVHFIHMYFGEDLGPGVELLEAAAARGTPTVTSLVDYWYACPKVKLIDFDGRICRGPKPARCAQCATWRTKNPVRDWSRRWHYWHRNRRLGSVLQKSSLLLPISDHVLLRYARWGIPREKMLTLKCGIQEPSGAPDSAELRPGEPTVSFIGTLIPEKGVHVLVEAVKGMSIQCRVRLFGGGPRSYTETLRRAAQPLGDRVEFCGEYDHRHLRGVLAGSDIVVVPSVWEEALGLVIQEALAEEKIVVASRIGGIPETILDGVNGFLVPPGDVEALARTLDGILRDLDGVRRRLRYDLGIYPIGQEARRLTTIYAGLVRGKGDGLRAAVESEFADDAATISRVLGWDVDRVWEILLREYRDPGQAVREAWRAANPKSESEVEQFYRTTWAYIFDLVVAQRQAERRLWRRRAIEVLARHGARTVLDFGGGIGEDGLAFEQVGMDATVYEPGEVTAAFARARLAREGSRVKVASRLEDCPVADAVFSTEVLEHLPRPLEAVRVMRGHLRRGGLLMVTHSFELVGDAYPSHLPANEQYAVGFVERVEELGFRAKGTVPLAGGKQFYLFEGA
jgi:glycosyltransferase involved in cell wall biosynthesis/SAM-dependent methyltransferase